MKTKTEIENMLLDKYRNRRKLEKWINADSQNEDIEHLKVQLKYYLLEINLLEEILEIKK